MKVDRGSSTRRTNYIPKVVVEKSYGVDDFEEPGPIAKMVEAIKKARGHETFRKAEEDRPPEYRPTDAHGPLFMG